MKCRFCHSTNLDKVIDLGYAPPSNAYRTLRSLSEPEVYYPLRLHLCNACSLVQTEDYLDASLLFTSDYAYYSSTSAQWLKHARDFSEKIIEELGLNVNSFVVEVASNDGYLLKNFVERNIPCLGIEPALEVANIAEIAKITVVSEFFTEHLADGISKKRQQADLIIANNVLAHVPDINDFCKGLKRLLRPNGTLTLEFPHLLQLIRKRQFDTIYHEHYSYLSLSVSQKILAKYELRIYNLAHLDTHGGSLRLYVCHDDDPRDTRMAVRTALLEEERFELNQTNTYRRFQAEILKIKIETLDFLISSNQAGKRVCAYGAAAKGNTLLNFCGLSSDLIHFIVDEASSKQGKFLPGSHIEIKSPEILETETVDYLVVMPWNIYDEIRAKYDWVTKRGTKFVRFVPEMQVDG